MAEATLNNEIYHARFLHPNLPPLAGEGANESLREFHVKEALAHRYPQQMLRSAVLWRNR